jgi:hypothetical protein
MLMQAKHVAEELKSYGWQYEQAYSVFKAINGIYERFRPVVLDFIWVV